MINIYDLTGSEQFKTLPYERKQYALNRYFTDFVSSDKRFLSLSDGEQKKAYSTFMKTHLGEPPMTPKEQAAYAQMVEADTITPEKAEQYNKQIELDRQSSDVIDIAPKLSLPKDYTPADTSKMDKESKKQYYRAAESLQIAKQLGNKESAEHWEGMLRHYKNKDEYDRTGVIISTAGQEAVRKQNLEFMASATRSDFPLEPTYPQQQLTKIKEKEAVEERKEQFYEKREQEAREQAISYQDNNRRLMRLALIKSSWTPEQNAEYGKLLKEQGEIEEYFKSGGLTPRQRDAIMMGSKAAKERNLASSMADAFFSGTLQFVTSPYTVFIPSSGISDYMYYYDMGYGSEVGAIESLFRGTVSSLPMNLMMMVNPAVGVALTMSSITSGGIKEDYEAGMLDAQTIMTNILSGAVQTAIEYMSADAQKAIYTKTFRTGGMKALQDAVHEDVKNVFFPTFKSFASAFGASAVEEGMEEIYQNVADRIIRATVNDEEMPDLKEWVPELAYEFAGGFLGAALTGTAFSAIQISQSKKMQQNITKYANQGYEYAQLTQNAIDAVNAGNYDQAFNLISQAQDAAREIGNPNKQVLQGIGTVQSAIMMYDKNKIVVTEAIIDAHEIRAKELRQELTELKKARYVNEDAALSRDARVLEIQEELVEIRDNILARQQSLVANEHVAVMKKSMDKMIEHIEANPELAEKYALQAAQAQESALLSTREISERDKAGLQAGISTEDDYRTAVDRHFTEGLADEVIEMEMKPGDFAPSRIEPYVYTDINIDESVTPKKTKEKKTDVKSEAKEDKEMAKPEPLAEDTLKTIKAEADKAIASKDKANLQKAKKTLDEALKENKDQRLVDIRRSLNSEIADIVEQERAVKEKEKAKKAKKAKEEADKQQREDMTKRRKDELITKGIEAAAEKYGINIKQYKTRSEIADAIIERQDAVRKSLAEHRRAMGTDYEKIKEAARELEVPIKGKKEVLKQEVLKAREAQIIKEISTKETLHHERGLLKEYNESMKPKVDETVQKIDGIVQEVKDTRIDLSRETDEAKRSEYEAEISKNVKEIDSVIAELKSIQKEAGDNYIAVEKIQAEINKLEKVARPLSEADVTQRTDVNLNKANELIDTRSIEETGVIPEAQIGDTATVSKENDNFEITYILVPIDEVVTSHNIDTLNQNENYPAELQNRVRENHAEDVNKIAAKLNPRILMHNDIASDGRPIGFIGKDGKVYIIAGNGRTIALKMRADGQYGNLNQYEQVLKSNLKELGFQDQDVAGKMLVGIYNGREDLVKLAISLNRGETQALSETEAARTDARTLIKLDESGDGIIRLLSRKGDILSESNNKFINAFIDEVVPESERSKYRAKGKILVKVEERIKNALFMYVFDDSSKAASLLSSLEDVGDSNVKSMLHGIMENVKEMALLKYLDASYDFSSDLIDAVHETESLRAKGENLDIAQNQMDVFADDEVKSHLLTAVYRIKSPKEAAGFVKAYTEISLKYADGGQDTMDFAKLTKEQIRAEFLKRWLFGEIKDMKSAKEAYIKARELTVHKPLAELEFTLYEAMAEQLAPRMGLTVDEYFAKYFDVFTTEAPTETETEASEQSIEYQLQAEGYEKGNEVDRHAKTVNEAEKRNILFQSQESVQKLIKGYVERMPNGKYRVGFMDADVTTGLHEQGHIGKDMLYEMAKIDPAWERYVKIAEEFCGVGEDGVWTTDAEEKFANGYVKYITEGKAPTPQLKTVFEKLKDLISKAVSKIAEIMNIELTDDIREVYGALLGAEITTKEDTRKAKVDAFITKVDAAGKILVEIEERIRKAKQVDAFIKVDAADFASKDVDVLTKRLDSEFGPQSRFMTDRKLSRGKVHMNIIDMGNTIVNIAQVDDGYIVNGEHAYNNGEAMDIVNKLIDDYAPGDIDMGEKDSTRFQMPSYARDTNLIRYQKSDAYEKKQKFIQEQNETNAKIIREELDTAPSAEKAKEAVVNAIKRALMINYEGAEAMDVIKRREIARAIKEQQKLGNTEAVEKLKAALELMRKRDQRFRDILREETGFRNINNITLEQALKMLDRVDPVLYDRFVNESTRKVLVNSINLLESMGKKGFVYDKNTLDLFFDYFTSEHVDTVKRSSLSTLFLMPQRYLVETFGKAGQKLVELAYLGTVKRSDYEHQYHPSLQRIYDLQMTNKNGRGRAYRGEEIDAIGRTILEVDGNSRIAQEDKLNTIQSVLEQWAEDNGTVINKGDIEDMYNAKQDIIAIFEGIIVEFNNSPIAKLHGIEIGLLEEYGNPRTYEQASSTEPGKDKILHVPANVKERTATDYNAEAKHNTNLYEVYLSYATSMAKYMAFYELAAYMEGNEELIPGSGESEGTVIVPAQFFRDISSIQRVAAKGALRENGYVHKYIKNVIGYGEAPTSATRMFGALKTITFASTLVPSIPMTILNFHQRTLIDTQVGAEIAWQVRKDIKFFSGRGRFDSEAFPTLSRIMDMYRGADTSLIAETVSAAQKSATEGGRSWFAKMYYKGAEFSAKMLEASPFSKAELGNRAYAHLAGIYQIVTQTAEYKQARKEGMKFRQAVEHVLTNHDNIRQDAIHNGGVVNAEINADVNPAFAPQIFWKDTSVHKYLMFVRYGITLAQLEMRKFAAPFLSMKSRQSQQIYDMLRSGNIQAADHAQYIQAAQIMLKMTDERARSKMLAEGKIDSKKMSDKRLSIQEVESFHNMLQQILDESIDVAKEKHSDVIKGTKTETLEAAQMMNFTIRELMLRTILAFVISMLPTWRKDKKEIDIIAMLSELNTYIGLFQTPQMITDFRLGGAMVPRLEYYYKDKQIIKGLTDWALRSLPGIGILNNFIKGITGKAISDDIVDAAYPSKQQKGKRNK